MYLPTIENIGGVLDEVKLETRLELQKQLEQVISKEIKKDQEEVDDEKVDIAKIIIDAIFDKNEEELEEKVKEIISDLSELDKDEVNLEFLYFDEYTGWIYKNGGYNEYLEKSDKWNIIYDYGINRFII